MPIIVDAHEDIADNMLVNGRDYIRPVAETRRLELENPNPFPLEPALIGWDAYQRGQVAVVFSTLFVAPYRRKAEWAGLIPTYASPDQAHELYAHQLDVYHRMADEHPDHFRLVRGTPDLEKVLKAWEEPVVPSDDPQAPPPVGHPVGLVVLMEGADGVRGPSELDEWWEGGVRIIGLAWAGTRYSGGTREPGPLTREGRELIAAMAERGFTLDLSHMDAEAALQALESYPGPVMASHANPLAMLKGSDSNRHLPDSVVDGLIERGGVIGIVPYNAFLLHGWKAGAPKAAATLETVVSHIDYICQRAGDALHVGIGSDFDGGFGLPSVPAEVDTLADLQKLSVPLSARGYSPADIEGIFSGNWLNFLRRNLPDG